MFLLALLALSPSFAAFEPCTLSELHLDLPLYVRISQSLAQSGVTTTSVLYATAPDPMFDDDKPIEFRFVPSLTPTLTIVVTHYEAMVLGDKPVTIAAISDQLVIDLAGNVNGNHSCETRLAMADAALEQMRMAYKKP